MAHQDGGVARMPIRGLALAILAAVLLGCEAAPAPSVPATQGLASPVMAIATPTAPPGDPETPRATPRSTDKPTPSPTGVKITRKGCYTGPVGSDVSLGTCTTTIRWKQPLAKGTEIRIYGVTTCLSANQVADGGSCLNKHTSVPVAERRLIVRAPASRGKATWTGPASLDNVVEVDSGGARYRAFGVARQGDHLYFAIMLAAYDAAGHSEFAIVDAGNWCDLDTCAGP